MRCGAYQDRTFHANEDDSCFEANTRPTDPDLAQCWKLLSWSASEFPEIEIDDGSNRHESPVEDMGQKTPSGCRKRMKRRVRLAAIICAYLQPRTRLSVESEIDVLRRKADTSAMDVQTICDLLVTGPISRFSGEPSRWHQVLEFYAHDEYDAVSKPSAPPFESTESLPKGDAPAITAVEVGSAFREWFPSSNVLETPAAGPSEEVEGGENVLPLLRRLFAGLAEQDKGEGVSDPTTLRTDVKILEVDIPFLRELYDVTARVYYHAALLHMASVFGVTHFSVDELRWRCRWAFPRVFRCLIWSGNAARISALLLGSSWSERFLCGTLRRYLYGELSAEAPLSGRAWVCEGVELSALRSVVASGIGLLATEPLQEGSLILCESPLIYCLRSQLAVSDRLASDLGVPNLLLAQLTEICRESEEILFDSLEVIGKHGISLLGFCTSSCSKENFAQEQRSRVSDYLRLIIRLPCLSHFPEGDSHGVTYFERYSRECLVSELLTLTQRHHEMTGVRDVDEFKIGLAAYPSTDFLGPREVGKGLYSLVRFINHACCPNAMLYFPLAPFKGPNSVGEGEEGCPFSTEVCIVALKDITAGEEITIAYPDTRLFFSRQEREKLSGFSCTRCQNCSEKQIFLEGIYCRDCGQLMRLAEPHSRSVIAAPVVSHQPALHGDTCAVCGDNAELSLFKSSVTSHLDALQKSLAELEQRLIGDDNSAGEDETEIDRPTLAVRQLLSLDENLGLLLPGTHCRRLSLRLTLLAVSTAAARLSLHDSTRLLRVCGEFVKDMELLTGPNDPLRTGVRMQYVFARARHVTAVLPTRHDAQGGIPAGVLGDDGDRCGRGSRHVGCCGAIREEEEVLARPYMRDGPVRECVMRCFQEHYCQCLGWCIDEGLGAAGDSPERLALTSFLERYPVELEAAGCSTIRDLDMIACIATSTNENYLDNQFLPSEENDIGNSTS